MKNKRIFNGTTILTIVGCIILFLTITFFTSTETYALTDKIDISIRQPIVVIQGEEITTTDIKNILYYEGISLKNSSKPVTLKLPGSAYVVSNEYDCNQDNISIKTWRHLIEGEYAEGTLSVGYGSSTINIPFIIKYNYSPEVHVPHIYISETDLSSMSKSDLCDRILEQVSIDDPEGRTDLTPEINNPESYSFNANQTTRVSVSVEDYARTVTVPAYVTIVASHESEGTASFDNTKVRAISKEYYPYCKTNIMKSGGIYGAKKDTDGYLYFIDTEGNFLTTDGTPDGKKYSVDSCLKSVIVRQEGEIYYVIPISKWATNRNCISLLTSCFESDDDTYVQSWTFDENDIYTIKKQLISGTLDENFYTNHYANGYCEDGTRLVNETKSISTNVKSLGTDGLQWYISDDTLHIIAKDVASESYTYKMPDFALKVNKYDNMKQYVQEYESLLKIKRPVKSPFIMAEYGTKIKSTAPWANYSFSKVKIDDKVTYIGAYSFAGMDCISGTIEIPTNCYRIGEGAFMNCVCMTGSLKTKYVSIIDPFAFANCQGLTGSLIFGTNAITEVGDYAFYNCGFTESLKLPSSITTIGKYAFAHCSDFNGNLILSANLTELGEGAFMNCSGFNGDLNLSSNLKEIKALTFAHCTGFSGKLALPDNITTIGDYAFYNCKNILGNLSLPEKLKTIGVGAFKNCRSIKDTLTINKALETIAPEAFANCVNITKIDNRKVTSKLSIKANAFLVDVGIVKTDLLKKTPDGVFSKYPLLGDRREVLNY